MNYSRNLRKWEMTKRIIMSWLVVAAITAVISGAIGFALGINAYGGYQEVEVTASAVPAPKPATTQPIHITIPTSQRATQADASEAADDWISLGTFKLTAYCSCRKCNGKWYGHPTAAGTDYVEGRTIAVWKNQIPLGSKVRINGHEYTAEDTGSAIKANCTDVFINSHERARQFGVQYAEVFVRR